MPAAVKSATFAALALLMAGAIYLIAVRGDALLADLSQLGAKVFCF